MAGKKQYMAPMWKKMMKNVDFDRPTSLLDHVYWGCTQRECKPNEILLGSFQRCLNLVFLLEQLKSYRGGKNLRQIRLRGPTTWKDMLENALRDIVNWRTKRQSSYTKSQVLAWMIIISRKRNLNQLENCQKYAHKLSCNACTWHQLVGLTFFGQ